MPTELSGSTTWSLKGRSSQDIYIDEIAWYERVLTEVEVKARYEMGKPYQ